MTEVIKLDLLPDNTSDYYPLITQLDTSLDSKETIGRQHRPKSKKIWKNPGAHYIVSWELDYMGKMD